METSHRRSLPLPNPLPPLHHLHAPPPRTTYTTPHHPTTPHHLHHPTPPYTTLHPLAPPYTLLHPLTTPLLPPTPRGGKTASREEGGGKGGGVARGAVRRLSVAECLHAARAVALRMETLRFLWERQQETYCGKHPLGHPPSPLPTPSPLYPPPPPYPPIPALLPTHSTTTRVNPSPQPPAPCPPNPTPRSPPPPNPTPPPSTQRGGAQPRPVTPLGACRR